MDWNVDGKKDLVVGDTDGYIYIYINTGTDDKPVLSEAQLLQLSGDTFNLGNRAKPEIADWNADGKKDLIVGLDHGEVYLLINTGTDAAPVFTEAAALPLKVGLKPEPRVFDWNADGKKDLLFADEGGQIHYLENTGADDKPAFKEGVLLQAAGKQIKEGYRSRLAVTDWNNDGAFDLLYGVVSFQDQQGYLYLYLAQKN